MDIQDNYRRIRENIALIAQRCGRSPEEVRLVAVSKRHPLEAISAVHEAGCVDFGENRLTEALEKVESGPPGVHWHFVGSIQSKKLPKVMGRFHLLHGIDSLELVQKLAKRSQEQGLSTAILLQVNVSKESSKHGWFPEQLEADWEVLREIEGVDIQGLMTMAPFTRDEDALRQCFSGLRLLRDRLASPGLPLRELSMGMTNDYPIAIEEGATLVRVGTAIFGERVDTECG